MTTTLITISEQSITDNGFIAELAFNHQRRYQITITLPFDEKQENDLAWYFEKYLAFPFTDNIRFNEVAQSIKTYGEQLFKQVFHEPDAYSDYRDALKTGFTLEIIGSPAFHALHWESLKNSKHPSPFALKHEIVRKPLHFNSRYQAITAQTSPTLNVLLVVARPNGRNDVAYRTISYPLVNMLRNSSELHVHCDILRPATYEALNQQLEMKGKGFYHIIHFDVHGSLMDYDYFRLYGYNKLKLAKFEDKQAFIFLLHEKTGKHAPISALHLTELLKNYDVPVVLLNACQSAKQENTSIETSLASYLMQAGIQAVVGMAYSVMISAAKLFMQTLYEQLFKGQSLAVAIQMGRVELQRQKTRRAYYNKNIELEDWLLPVVYQQVPQVSFSLRKFTPEEERSFRESNAQRFEEPITSYGFFGRDLDILEIETRILQRNLLLIQSMGGAGKTTLLKHLGAWWQTTHFVGKVFYFGYDTMRWNRQQIMREIAIQLWGQSEYEQRFQAFTEDAQQKKLAKALRSERHLLMLDNLESITGSALAIQNVLSEKERGYLQHFLRELLGGKSLVLLGSCGAEEWLATGTFAQNQYVLQGLDPEATSQLVDSILTTHQIKKTDEQQDDFKKLLKLLAGYPLALQVVLKNLTSKTPTEILTALTTGDSSIDLNSTDKTQSILRCIEDSHSNLSTDAQQLLLCLAPFMVVVNVDLLPQYTDLLKQQPALAHLPFDKWESVLQEAKHWGLLAKFELPLPILNIHPLLSYFLKNSLNTQPMLKAAIEASFRLFYMVCGRAFFESLQENHSQEGQDLQFLLTHLEYENFYNALQASLEAKESIIFLFETLSNYLNRQKYIDKEFNLAQQTWIKLEKYPSEVLDGEMRNEILSVLARIAVYFQKNHYYAESEQGYLKILEIWKFIKTEEKNRKETVWGIYGQLGYIKIQQKQFNYAEKYLNAALNYANDLNDSHRQCLILYYFALFAQAQDKKDDAINYFTQSMDVAAKIEDKSIQTSVYGMYAQLAFEQENYIEVEKNLNAALQLNKDVSISVALHIQFGLIKQKLADFEGATEYFKKALQICIVNEQRNNKFLLQQAFIYGLLGLLEKENGQSEQSIDYLAKALEIFMKLGTDTDINAATNILLLMLGFREQHPDLVAQKVKELGIKLD
jgi:tetratricopeptide (TPR) repeat protein